MSYSKGHIGSSMIIEQKKKPKRKLKKNEKYNSAKARCPKCKNSVEKYTIVSNGKKYCVRCFSNYNQKIEMVKLYK